MRSLAQTLLPRIGSGCRRGLKRSLAMAMALLLLAGIPLSQSAADAHERLVITTSGDNFSLISLREFGTTGFGRLIAEYNQLPYASQLSAGQVLRIPISPALAAEHAGVVFSKGGPLVMVRGNRQELREVQTGDKIYVNDIIKTTHAGFVSLRFPSGTVVNIQPNSLVQLLALDCLEERENCIIGLDARSGSVTSNVVRKNGQPTRFNVRTPHASAAVRGTVFDIDASAERMLLGVTEGNVDVTAQGRSTDVLQGLGIRTLAGQASDPPIRLLPSPNFRRIAARLTSEDTLAWYRLDHAASYILQIARDADGAAAVYTTEMNALREQMQSLSAGNYFARLRGVDENGFKGFVNVQPLQVAEIDEDAFVPALVRGLQDGELLLTVPDLPDSLEEYEMQMSFREDFLELSSVDVPADGGIKVVPADVTSYFRARSITGPTTVGRFGPVLSIPAQ